MLKKFLTLSYKRKPNGYSLIETMAVLAVLGIVMGLLYAYSNNGWKFFYQSYSRGLSQVKARLAVRILSDDLIDANKSRINIGRGTSFGIPFPDDVKDSSPFIYFTKPVFYESTGDVIGYDYILYYYAKPKQTFEEVYSRKIRKASEYLILKSIKFKSQSKVYTEDREKNWPFLPPVLEISKSTLPEDDEFIKSLGQNFTASLPETNSSTTPGSSSLGSSSSSSAGSPSNNLFLDHFSQLKSASRTLPISGNFTTNALTDPFTSEQASFLFGQDYKNDQIVKIKVSIEEPPLYFGIMAVKSDFEIKVTPRN